MPLLPSRPRSLTARRRLTACALLASTALLACAGLTLAAHGAKPVGIKCKLSELKDTEKSGLIAYTYFVPDGWQSENYLKWGKYDDFTATLTATTADKRYAVNQIEPLLVSYMSFRNSTRGLRIIHATDFLHVIVAQIEQQFKATDIKVIEELNEPLPLTAMQERAQSMNWGPMQTRNQLHESGYLKVSFSLNGKPETAALGTTVSGTNTRMHALNNVNETTSESGVYRVGPTMVVANPSAPSALMVKEMQIVASSMKPTPKFAAFCRKLTASLAKAQLNINKAAFKASNTNWHERSMAAFRGQMAGKDANTHQFCNYILDQQDYRAQGGKTVTLPTAYNHSWSDGKGGYVLSGDPTLDPRGYGGGNWKQMFKATPKN
ncbi:MAG: hypothetical protein ACYC96_16780 [Fimbriimonadaceae bacterium]